jgi:hypothetical protein
MNNLFHRKSPVCINLLDINNKNEFYIKNKIIIIGNVPKDIQKEIEMVRTKNVNISNKLDKFYGKRWKSILHLETNKINKPIKGGDDDDWNDIDFDNLINENFILKESNVNKQLKLTKLDDVNYIYDINLYEEENIKSFKNKLQLITGIEYYKQYVSSNDLSVGYYINIDNGIDYISTYPDITKINFNESIEGIPINRSISESINNVKIISNDYRTLLKTYSNKFNLISVDRFIKNKKNINILLKSDIPSFEIIYNSFILYYFPVFSYNLFNLYITNESDISIQYPDTISHINKDTFNTEIKSIEEINNIPSNKSYKINTNNINLYYENTNISGKILSIKYMFNAVELVSIPNIDYIDLYTYINNKPFLVRKINKLNTSNNSISLVPSSIYSNSLVLYCSQFNIYKKLVIIIDEYGNIEINVITSSNTILDYNELIKILSVDANKIINELNKLSTVFYTSERLLPINNLYKIRYTSVNIIFTNQYRYDNVIDLLDKYISNKIFVHSIKIPNYLYKIYILDKFITSYPNILIDRLNIDTNNEFEYLTSTLKKRGMLMNILNSKYIKITNINEFIRVELLNLSIEESNFYTELLSRLFEKNSKQLVLYNNIGTNIKLANIDPVLFKFNADVNYSRLCQKKFQPVITDKNDPKGIKYYNHTYKKDEYYKCPDKIYNNLGMILNKHPNNYCLPCCRKNAIPKETLNQCYKNIEPEDIYNPRTYIQYIREYPPHTLSNYSILNRKLYLPKYIQELLHSTDLMVNGYIQCELADNLKLVSDNDDEVCKLSLSNKYDTLIIFSKYLELALDETILTIYKFISDNPFKFNKLLNFNIYNYFSDYKAFLSEFKDIYMLGTNLYNDIIPWNDIFIDIFHNNGLSTILLIDNRMTINKNSIDNIPDITLSRITIMNENQNKIFILKRLSIEQSNSIKRFYNYLPITTISKGVKTDRELWTNPINSRVIESINNILENHNKTKIKSINAQFNLDNLIDIINSSNDYKIITIYNNIKCISKVVSIANNKTYKKDKSVIILNIVPSLLNNCVQQSNNIDFTNLSKFNKLLEFIEFYNLNILNKFNMVSYIDYLKFYKKNNPNTLNFNFPKLNKYLLKVNRFLIYGEDIIGAQIIQIHENRIVGKTNSYFKPLNYECLFKPISDYFNDLNQCLNKLNKTSCSQLLSNPINFHFITPSIINNVDIKIDNFKYLFSEYIINPTKLSNNIKYSKKIINIYDRNEYKVGIYDRYIYKLLVHQFNMGLQKMTFTHIKKYIISLYKNNPVKNIHDLFIKKYKNEYNEEILFIVITNIIQYISNIPDINEILTTKLPIDNILKDSLYIANKEYIKKWVLRLLEPNISIINSIDTKTIIHSNMELNISNPLFYKDNKLLILKSKYSNLIDILVSDLYNPFKKLYIYNDINYSVIINNSNFYNFKNELIYISIIKNGI